MVKYMVKSIFSDEVFYANTLVEARKKAIDYGRGKTGAGGFCDIYQIKPTKKFLGLVGRMARDPDGNIINQHFWQPNMGSYYGAKKKLYSNGTLKKTEKNWPYRLK